MRPRAGKGDHAGFTMIELMTVVVVVAVLAAIAIPLYGRYIRNSRIAEATTRISEIITAAKSHAVANPDASGNPTWPPAAGGGIVSLASTPLFSYAITAGASGDATSTPFTVTATGITGLKMEGVIVTVTVAHIGANGVTMVDLNVSGGGAAGGGGGEGEGDGGGDGGGSGNGDGGDGGEHGGGGGNGNGGGNGGEGGDGGDHGNGHGHGHD